LAIGDASQHSPKFFLPNFFIAKVFTVWYVICIPVFNKNDTTNKQAIKLEEKLAIANIVSCSQTNLRARRLSIKDYKCQLYGM